MEEELLCAFIRFSSFMCLTFPWDYLAVNNTNVRSFVLLGNSFS